MNIDNNKCGPGVIIDTNLLISCKINALRPTVIQRSGKRALKLAEALNGWKVPPGTFVKSKLD